MAGEVTPTQEEFVKKIQEWSDKKGRKPNTIELRQIWADMLAEGTAQTDEERAQQEKIDKQELTDAGINSLVAQLVGQSQQAVPVVEQPPVVRAVAADVKNLLDPLTGKAIKEIDRGTTTGTYNYSGMKLVDENGNITQSVRTDNSGNIAADTLFQEMNSKGLLPKTLLALKASGHYFGKSPSEMALRGQGMTQIDYAAFDSFVNAANLARYTPKGFLARIEKDPGSFSVSGGGSGSSIAYPNEMDISRTLRNESFAALGRPMTPAEIRVAINFVKQSYASAGGAGGEQAPSLQAAAETAVAKTSGEEGAVYSLGMALDRMFAGQGSV
jgi:hypothetical protein